MLKLGLLCKTWAACLTWQDNSWTSTLLIEQV